MYFLKLFLAVIFIVACNASDSPLTGYHNPKGVAVDNIKQQKVLELLTAHYNWAHKNLLRALSILAKKINYVAEVIKATLKRNPTIKNVLGHRYKRNADITTEETPSIVNETNDNEIVNDCDSTGSKSDLKCNAEISGRRSMGGVMDTSFIKDKLLFYVQESIREIQMKVNSLVRVKAAFSNVVPFRMGYIVANIDTLAVNMKNLRQNMEANKNIWDERQILNVYDRLKISNAIVSNLLAVLRAYIGRV
ncbi:unnamed protein product [Parnassius apollo]|uniref:(apollo) hypothetical protein n=1 Tax=Parnassius apollo TaxID=110799 RepID=A0A8S3WBV9_PARAO|nr:unnamed protein product [Parnassius apollo]